MIQGLLYDSIFLNKEEQIMDKEEPVAIADFPVPTYVIATHVELLLKPERLGSYMPYQLLQRKEKRSNPGIASYAIENK